MSSYGRKISPYLCWHRRSIQWQPNPPPCRVQSAKALFPPTHLAQHRLSTVQGGLGTMGCSPILQEIVIFIQRVYPRLKHLITVCTGSGLAAQAGVLDGKRATSNKKVFKEIMSLRPQVHWVSHAWWVTDGNIWTSSGVSAGIDATLAWIEEVYGKEKAQDIANEIEYFRHENASRDPFAGLHGVWGLDMSGIIMSRQYRLLFSKTKRCVFKLVISLICMTWSSVNGMELVYLYRDLVFIPHWKSLDMWVLFPVLKSWTLVRKYPFVNSTE